MVLPLMETAAPNQSSCAPFAAVSFPEYLVECFVGNPFLHSRFSSVT